jgi:hypothetical protein
MFLQLHTHNGEYCETSLKEIETSYQENTTSALKVRGSVNSHPVTSKIEEYNWEVLPHHSPHMSHFDYDLFPKYIDIVYIDM